MRILVVTLVMFLLASAIVADDSQLTRDEQTRIIETYLYVTGQTRVMPLSLSEQPEIADGMPIKSGTPAVLNFMTNFDKLDKDLRLSLGAAAITRPTLDSTFDSPGGFFKIHYSIEGEAAVYDADVDLDGDGVPDYVEKVAEIADSVYFNVINVLGFPRPISDSACDGGGDARCDILLPALSSNVFGLTTPDTSCSPVDTATGLKNLMITPAFLMLDNDYAEIDAYRNRPLDAVRVTLAHEFFHVVQFSMDWTEWDNLYWLEASATWMEEMLYDDINDYYAYLPYFYGQPNASLEQFLSGSDLHPYGSVVFPIYLSEKFGVGIIRKIWEKSVDLGVGGDFLESAEWAIDSISSGTLTFHEVFAEFALWNYFTGSRADNAPNDIGYSEKANYPLIPEDAIDIQDKYPIRFFPDDYLMRPQHNAASYITLANTHQVVDRFFVCDDTACNTMTEVFDTINNPYDIHDSLFSVRGWYESLQYVDGIDTTLYPWLLSIVYRMNDDPDSFFTETLELPSLPCITHPFPSCNQNVFLQEIPNVDEYYSVTFIFTPSTPTKEFYDPRRDMWLGYGVEEENVINPIRVNIPAAVLIPYPNPAVVSNLPDGYLTFSFQAPTDSLAELMYASPHVTVDVYDVAGELVVTLDGADDGSVFGEYKIFWDMKNAAGNDVASGVYISYARLYSGAQKKELLAEALGKVAVIR